MALVQNPFLPGFNPDPSILRVGEDFYVATSTFEWYPGVQIHHSRDLVNWRLLTRPLRRQAQLDMRGDPDSCGVWAPALRFIGGQFYLIYTDMKRYGRTSGAGGAPGASMRDLNNFLVTAETIDGEWSDPVFLNSSGFDPSIFADNDGRIYVLNQLWDHRPGKNRFGGIVLQEYDPAQRRLIGERHNIFKGTPAGLTEAPHIHKRNGWYYLITAEGGTYYQHQVTLARSRELLGPYELHPENPLVTSRNRPDAVLQRAGHADWCELATGETIIVFLCSRPLRNRGRSVLGRESAIARLRWGDDDWPRLVTSIGRAPEVTVDLPDLPPHPFPSAPARADFDTPLLPIEFQWLRSPAWEELFSLTARPGYLRLNGRDTIGSVFRQALVARRQQAFCYSASTLMDYAPQQYQQAAGLVCYYNAAKFHYLYVSQDEDFGRHLRVMSALPDGTSADSFTTPIPLPPGPVHLRVEVDDQRLLFAWSLDGAAWNWLPENFDASILSDEAATPATANFTGAFVGMCCQDTAGTGLHADFDWFEYRERPFVADPRAT
jgi:xylan 1,4-beta-xylosidase